MTSPYKLLALDMDGTLLDSRKQVSPKTQQAIEELAKTGVAVAYCTGRSLPEMRDVRRALPFVRYGSQVSGALTYDFETDTVISATPLSTDICLQLIRAGALENAMVHMHCVHASVTRQVDIDRMHLVRMATYRSMFEEVCTRTDDLEAYVREHEGQVLKINLYHMDTESRERTRRRIQGLPIKLADSERTSLESTAQGISKDKGIERICSRLGIGMDQVVAIGDAPNDTDVLRAAGCAVAMGNATPEIKQLADLVVADNDHDGIAEAIERLF
jgi:Cof subfamily protein (haloacid dehalogenase superfamily)